MFYILFCLCSSYVFKTNSNLKFLYDILFAEVKFLYEFDCVFMYPSLWHMLISHIGERMCVKFHFIGHLLIFSVLYTLYHAKPSVENRNSCNR